MHEKYVRKNYEKKAKNVQIFVPNEFIAYSRRCRRCKVFNSTNEFYRRHFASHNIHACIDTPHVRLIPASFNHRSVQ